MKPLLEVCVDSAGSARSAERAGAGRIELCSALALGGLTPSHGAMRDAAGLSIPVYALIRPRDGDFCYDAAEAAIMREDVIAARTAGLSGVVLGALTLQGDLDAPLLADLLAAADLPATLHRAFDMAGDPYAALETAIDLGFERILTSGQVPSAPDGVDLLADLIARAAGRIAIMPGAGIDAGNVDAMVRATGATEIHSSCSVLQSAGSGALAEFEFVSATGLHRVDSGEVAAMVAAMESAKEDRK